MNNDFNIRNPYAKNGTTEAAQQHKDDGCKKYVLLNLWDDTRIFCPFPATLSLKYTNINLSKFLKNKNSIQQILLLSSK